MVSFDRDKLVYVEYDLFEDHPQISGYTYLRHGGTSKPPFDALNCSSSVGDHPDSVKVNQEMIRIASQAKSLHFAKQVHGKEIGVIRGHSNTKKECDGLITKEKGIGLAITHADCQAALFYDPKNHVIGAAHAGWRGLVQNIYKEMVETFVKEFGSNPKDLLVAISPSICAKHSEFIHFKEEFPKELWRYEVNKNHIDLQAIGCDQLKEAGIADKNIEMSEICTYENSKDCYSYRRQKETGRHASVITLI